MLTSEEWPWMWLTKKTERRRFQLLYQNPARHSWPKGVADVE